MKRSRWRARRALVTITAALSAAALSAAALSAAPAHGAAAAGSSARAVTPEAASHSITWTADSSPFRLSFFDQGQPLVAQPAGTTAGPGTRMAYQVGGSATSQSGATYHELTDLISSAPVPGGTSYTIATDEPDRTATVVVTQTIEGARVQWSFTPSDDVTLVFDALTAAPTEHYLSGSSAAYIDLRGHIRGWSPGKEGNEAGSYCQNQEQNASSFYLSSGGYGLYAETDSVGRFAFPGATQVADASNCGSTPSVPRGAGSPYPCPVASTAQDDRVQICVKASSLTYDIFAGTPEEVTTDYYKTVGMPSLPPPSEFGLMKWRDVSQNQDQVLGDVSEFKTLGIPIQTIWIDNPWEQQPATNTSRINGSACTNSGKFDSRFFPDPQSMINTIHAEGVKFGLWVGPEVTSPSASQGGGSCSGINSVWSQNGWLIPGTNYIDFTIPAARQYYIDQLTNLFSMGVDMAKEDRGEEYRLETAPLSDGSGSTLYLQYPELYHFAVAQALRNVNGDDFETLVRSGVPGTAEDNHGMWGSDTNQTFAGLRTMLRYGISESLTGDFAWGSDTGGIDPLAPANSTNSPTPSLFTRWAQFSALSPIYEVGGAGLNATPWVYPTDTVSRFRASVILHYELFPYFYALAEQAAATGVPILRAVGYEYPDDQQAWAQDQELMIGPDLLAAPVIADRAEADGEAGNPTPVSVYLPAGQWIDLYSGQVVQGGQTITRPTSLDEIPLYMKAGTAIGFGLRSPDVWASGWNVDDLSQPGRSSYLIAPAQGQAQALSSEQGSLTSVTAGAGTEIHLRGAPSEAQVLVLEPKAPAGITLNGRVLPSYGSPDELRAAPDGWVMTSAPFGGVLLKLQLTDGNALLHIRYEVPPR